MTEEATAVNNEVQEVQDATDEYNVEDNVLTLRQARLIRLKKKMARLRKLKKEALEGYASELKECKNAFNEANDLIGELNDAAGGKQS